MSKMKEETIKLYEEKIAWAKGTQDPNGHPSRGDMLQQIGHSWDGSFCPYCKKYNNAYVNHGCILEGIECPLLGANKISCCNGLWQKMNFSNIWAEWITNAEKVLEYIKEHG
jgi:hypothetical protein